MEEEKDVFEQLEELAEQAQQLLDDINDLSDDLDDFKIALDDSPSDHVIKKKSIVTTVTDGQPDFVGRYAGMTNADFAAGSVCYVLSN